LHMHTFTDRQTDRETDRQTQMHTLHKQTDAHRHTLKAGLGYENKM